MNIRHKDLLVDKDQPFKECKLGREKYARILTTLVQNYKDGFVLAINSEWGTGKTTFVKMWRQLLINQDFNTLYFNAWESDFVENPMIAFMAEFKSLNTKKSTGKLKALMNRGAKILKNVAPNAAKLGAESIGIPGALAGFAENLTKGAAEILEEEIKRYNDKKKGIIDFKKSLEEYIIKLNSEKPLIFIIDELDRCRPNYAVSLLENIKHLFSVPGIVFVLSIDKEQLGHAMRGVYGSEQLNANEYLRRFIDIEYNIPQPNTQEFVSYLYDYFRFDDRIRERERTWNSDESTAIQKFSLLIFENGNITLRQQEKIFAHARIALSSVNSSHYLLPGLFIYLVYLKHHDSKTYSNIKNKSLSVQELLDLMKKTIPKGIKSFDLNNIIYLEALLATTYHNFKFFRDPNAKLIQNEDIKENLYIKSHFDNHTQEEFKRRIRYIQNQDYRDLSINFIIDKIDLLQEVSM